MHIVKGSAIAVAMVCGSGMAQASEAIPAILGGVDAYELMSSDRMSTVVGEATARTSSKSGLRLRINRLGRLAVGSSTSGYASGSSTADSSSATNFNLSIGSLVTVSTAGNSTASATD